MSKFKTIGQVFPVKLKRKKTVKIKKNSFMIEIMHKNLKKIMNNSKKEKRNGL